MIVGPQIRPFDGMTVVGLHRPMSFAEPAMPELWRAFRPRVSEVEHRASEDFISARIYDDPPGPGPRPTARFDQWAAVEVAGDGDVPPGMDTLEVAGGLYAVFTYRGRAAAFAEAARFIYGDWLPGSGYVLAHRAFFEVLGPLYRPDDPGATEEIWIPIREGG